MRRNRELATAHIVHLSLNQALFALWIRVLEHYTGGMGPWIKVRRMANHIRRAHIVGCLIVVHRGADGGWIRLVNIVNVERIDVKTHWRERRTSYIVKYSRALSAALAVSGLLSD